MADTLVDLSYSKAELKEEKAEYASGDPSPYPWGLCIRLEDAELKKLGIKDLPQVGGEVHFTAVATVTGVNQSARAGQADERSVALQITMLQVTAIEDAAEEQAEGKQTPAKEAAESKGTSVLGKYR